ncbi:MAG: NIPSNAP family protein [Flavobacteriaceae bacterium]|nr:NIPSNAP family protein [Flavobacteriaceae bacterium]
MKKILGLFAVFIVFAGFAQTPERQLLQLKIYTFANTAQLQTTENYLENAFLPALRRLNVKKTGVFKMRVPDSTGQKLFVLIPFKNLAELNKLESQLEKDTIYAQAGASYLESLFDNVPYQRIETILLYAFKDMPQLTPTQVTGARTERVYELRSYQSPTEAYFKNKVKMFNEGGEISLFKELNFNAVFYGEVISGPDMPNLMYMTTFINQEDRDEHWKAFVDSPEWKSMSTDPKYQHNVSHIDITFLYPTEYSDY